jgi:hypothetical protein
MRKTLQPAGGAPLVYEAVFEEIVKRGEAVSPGDFLALLKLAPRVGYRYFIDAVLALENLGGHFDFDFEALGLELYALYDFGPEHLVTGFHV